MEVSVKKTALWINVWADDLTAKKLSLLVRPLNKLSLPSYSPSPVSIAQSVELLFVVVCPGFESYQCLLASMWKRIASMPYYTRGDSHWRYNMDLCQVQVRWPYSGFETEKSPKHRHHWFHTFYLKNSSWYFFSQIQFPTRQHIHWIVWWSARRELPVGEPRHRYITRNGHPGKPTRNTGRNCVVVKDGKWDEKTMLRHPTISLFNARLVFPKCFHRIRKISVVRSYHLLCNRNLDAITVLLTHTKDPGLIASAIYQNTFFSFWDIRSIVM